MSGDSDKYSLFNNNIRCIEITDEYAMIQSYREFNNNIRCIEMIKC